MVARRIPALALSVSMLTVAAGPAAAATLPGEAVVVTTTTAVGTATSRSVPLTVRRGDLTVQVGALDLLATTDDAVHAGGPFASTGVTLLDVAGTTFGQLEVRSDQAPTATEISIAEITPLGPVNAVGADLAAVADDTLGTASATLGALGAATSVLEQLDVAFSVIGAAADVSDLAAVSGHTLLLGDVDITLEALLGGVLAELPLDQLVALADLLGVEIPVSLDAAGELVTATEALVAAVAAVTPASQAVADAAAALVSADAANPVAGFDVAALTGLLDTIAAADVTNLTSIQTAIVTVGSSAAFIALGCDLGQSVALAALTTMQGCVQAELDAHTAAVAALGDEVAALQSAVGSFADALAAAAAAATTVQSSASALPDALTAIDGLVDDLLAFDLLHLDEVLVEQQATAVGNDLVGSSASATCADTSLTVLGLPAVDINGCDATAADVVAAVQAVLATVTDVLDLVGGIDAGSGVEVELFGTVADSVTEGEDGRVDATSTVEVLRVSVPDITVTPCAVADGLVCSLGLDLTGPLAEALAAIDGVLNSAQTAVVDGLDSVSGIVTALDETLPPLADGPVDPTQLVLDAVAALQAVIDGLDLGVLGDAQSVTVAGFEIVVDPEVTASHLVSTTTDVTLPQVEVLDSSEERVPEGAPLPNTGGGAALLAAAAIAGGVLLMRRRRED